VKSTDERSRDEFRALRATIKDRGTVRPVLMAVMMAAWGTLALVTIATTPRPLAFLFPLFVLVAAFEAVSHLHTGVERVGRYLQVWYEEAGGRAAGSWERVAMEYGQRFPGGGSDPLFSAVFAIATALNVVPVLVSRPRNGIWLAAVAAHVAFLVRLRVARTRAARQRAEDLERYRTLRAEFEGARPPEPPEGLAGEP
jgi:hypothetical protein